jgi:hypothetical protein
LSCASRSRGSTTTRRARAVVQLGSSQRGSQQQLEAVGATQRVGGFQQLERSGGIECAAVRNTRLQTHGEQRKLAIVVGHAQPLAQYRDFFQCRAGQQRREAHAALGGAVRRGHLGRRGRRGGSALQRFARSLVPFEFGQQDGERTAVVKNVEEHRRFGFAQRALHLAPHPLRHQRVDLAIGDHEAHQFARLRREPEAQGAQTCREAGDAQYAHRVLDKSGRDMTQQALLEIVPAPVGVDQRAVGAARHRVDGQIAALQVLLERHLGREPGLEAAVAGGGLALQPRQRVFLTGVRVQEHRELTADGAVAGTLQLLGRGAHHHPVALVRRQTEQLVPDRASHQIHLHGTAC